MTSHIVPWLELRLGREPEDILIMVQFTPYARYSGTILNQPVKSRLKSGLTGCTSFVPEVTSRSFSLTPAR
jgi:hypothetical protein